MPRMTPSLAGLLLALAAFATFSLHDVVVKILGEIYSPVQVLFFSALFGFPVLTVMLIHDQVPGTLRPRYPLWTGLRTLMVVLTGISAFYAFSVLPLAQTYSLIFAAPLLITLLAIPVLGEKVGILRLLAVLVGLAGVIVVLQPGAAPFSLGHLAGLTAAIGSATGSVIVRKIGREERSAVLLVYPMMANIVVMGAVLPFVYRPMPLIHLAAVAAIAIMAFAATGAMIAAYRRTEAVLVAPMQYSQIIWAAIFGALVFSEVPSRSTILGATIIIASGIFIVLREGHGRIDTQQPVLRTRSRLETGTYPRVGPVLRRRRDAAAEKTRSGG